MKRCYKCREKETIEDIRAETRAEINNIPQELVIILGSLMIFMGIMISTVLIDSSGTVTTVVAIFMLIGLAILKAEKPKCDKCDKLLQLR